MIDDVQECLSTHIPVTARIVVTRSNDRSPWSPVRAPPA
jgi:hypothetical protein